MDPSYYDDSLQRLLEPEERVLWQGKPEKSAYVWQQFPQSLFGVFFFGFAIFWEVNAWRQVPMEGSGGVGWLFRLFGLPFLIVGFYITFGHFFLRAWEWRHVNYVLTNRRMLTTAGLLSTHHASLFLDAITSVDLEQTFLDRGRGTWNVTVDAPTMPDYPSVRARRGFSGYPRTFGFHGIKEGEEVLRLLQEARTAARRSASAREGE